MHANPNVLITGCSSGIGRALAQAFQTAGYQVWASARREEDLRSLNEAGFNAVQLDVDDAASIERCAALLAERAGGLDILINNAGYGAMGPLLDGGAEAMRRQFETNVFSVVAVTRALFPLLRSRQGLVVNVGSVSALLVTPFAGAYCASKAALHALSDALRMELAPFAIGVMEVQPGAIESAFGNHASRQVEQLIDEHSAWWPMREGIRARARASQDNPTPASHVARQVLAAVGQRKRARVLRVGNGSRALPMLAALVPGALLDRILSRRFGLKRNL